jgi:hypothetical protein
LRYGARLTEAKPALDASERADNIAVEVVDADVPSGYGTFSGGGC